MPSEQPKLTCKQCTYDNEPTADICEICQFVLYSWLNDFIAHLFTFVRLDNTPIIIKNRYLFASLWHASKVKKNQ